MLEYIAEHSTITLQQELGRNRFLNELAKMLSPKVLINKKMEINKQYDAGRCPEAVKVRISEIFHDWAKMFPNQPKISIAYNTLFKKGKIINVKIKIKGYIIKNELKNKVIRADV